MVDLQREAFAWAASQPLINGLVVLAAGTVYAFFGFRFFRFLLALTCAGIGWAIGSIVALIADLPPEWLGVAGAVIFAALSSRWVKPAIILSASVTWGLLAYCPAMQLRLPEAWTLGVAGGAGLLGGLLAWLCYRTMTVILTTLQGIVLMLIGFVAVSTQITPTIGITFRQWANASALVTPVFLSMLFAAAFSYQSMHQQGDIRTGR